MRAAFALVLIVVLAAGCGGGGDDARQEFIKQADANCKQRQDAEAALQDRTEEEWAEDPKAPERIAEREIAAQRKLEPPDELAADWRRYLQLFEEADAKFRQWRTTAERRSRDDESVLERDWRRAAVQARQVAKRMGLDVCANAFY